MNGERPPVKLSAVTGNQHDGDKLLTLEDIVEMFQLSEGTIRKQRSEGNFAPAYKLGKHLRWRRSTVLQWLEDHADEE